MLTQFLFENLILGRSAYFLSHLEMLRILLLVSFDSIKHLTLILVLLIRYFISGLNTASFSMLKIGEISHLCKLKLPWNNSVKNIYHILDIQLFFHNIISTWYGFYIYAKKLTVICSLSILCLFNSSTKSLNIWCSKMRR